MFPGIGEATLTPSGGIGLGAVGNGTTMDQGEGSGGVSGDGWDPACPTCGEAMLPRLIPAADPTPIDGGRPLLAEVPVHLECPVCSPSE